MNTNSNFSRFLKVLSNEWRLNLKKMLLFWGGIFIITVLYFALLWITESMIMKSLAFGFSFFFLCILQGFYLQNYFHEFSSKTKTQALLLLPASRNETFWAKFTLGVILYILLALAYTFIVLKWAGIHNDWMREMQEMQGLSNDWLVNNFENLYQTLTIDLGTKLVLFLVWLFSASAYLFGNILFKKRPTFKTLAFWFIVGIGLWLVTRIVYFLFTGVWPTFAFSGIAIVINPTYCNSIECVIYEMYPEFWYGFGVFICLALIFISRIKYNEKTI